jgi:hypothetical protein
MIHVLDTWRYQLAIRGLFDVTRRLRTNNKISALLL